MNRTDLEQLPDIAAQKPTARYALVWFDHFNSDPLYRVVSTNLGTPSDDINNELFRSWCQPFTVPPSQPVAKLLAAADEKFKIDYTLWTVPPYSLPELDERWFEILDDERWYVVELA
jgi:hypothetical protein